MKKDIRNYTIKIDEGKEVVTLYPANSTRFFLTAKAINFKDGVSKKVYIRVNYGIKESHLAKMEMFDNSGTYTNKKDLMQAVNAFREEL